MEPEFKPGAAGWEARMIPLCYAAPLGDQIIIKPIQRVENSTNRGHTTKKQPMLSHKSAERRAW